MTFRLRLSGAIFAVVAFAPPAVGQDADEDWQIVRDPAQNTLMAAAAFETGLVIGVRCMGGSFGALVGGLPITDEGIETRPLRIGYGDDPVTESDWLVGEGRTTAFAKLPAPFARRLREGGVMNLVVPGGGGQGRNLRHVVTLPPSTSAIDEVLTACDRPLVDPRDAELAGIDLEGLPANLEWARRLRVEYPYDAQNRGFARGYAAITCVTDDDGSLRDCVVESEHPMGGGFGAAALNGARKGRVGVIGAPDASVGIRKISFSVNFRISDAPPSGVQHRRRN